MLTPRDIYNPELLDEDGKLKEASKLLGEKVTELADGGTLNIEDVRAAIAKLREPSTYPQYVGKGLPGPWPYRMCEWQGDGPCTNMATHHGNDTCEHEHVREVFACTEHRECQSKACSTCLFLDGHDHQCITKTRDMRPL